MRWPNRLTRPVQGALAFLSHNNSCILFGCLHANRKPLQISKFKRALWSSSRIQTKAAPKSASLGATQSPASVQAQNVHPHGPQWAVLALIFAASAGTAYLYRRQYASSNDDVINTSTFTPFTIIDREQVSPTAFIITLRPSAWVDPKALESGRVEYDGPAKLLSSRIQQAWRHGLWSVEIKQPQLQIARHYTPLPPLLTPMSSLYCEEKSPVENSDANEVQTTRSDKTERSNEGDDEQADLRILVRRMDGGEMSNYLSRRRVGDTVWLRGPHLGFDVPRRLGHSSVPNGDVETTDIGDRPRVVFLAGGTGIAPALQIAHKLLDGYDYSNGVETQPHISILWANRWGIDALGREQPIPIQSRRSSWFRFWDRQKGNPSTDKRDKQEQKATSSLAVQIQDLKRRHPSHFEISYFVDSEGSFIKPHDVEAALTAASANPSGASGPSSSSANVNKSCTWHSARAVELLPDDNDAARSASLDPACACTCTPKAGVVARPCTDLICVSGPDGFIEAYAGAKRWHDGNEMQGAVRGLIGRLQRDKGTKAGELLVLKL